MLEIKKLTPYIAGLLLFGCQHDSATDLQNDLGPVTTVTYSQHVQSIISNNCIQCHSDPPQNGAPMRLTIYDAVKEAVQNRDLIGRISIPEGQPGHMPLGGPKLPDATINLIIQWRDQGFLE